MMVKEFGSWRRGGDVEVFFQFSKKKKNGNHKKKSWKDAYEMCGVGGLSDIYKKTQSTGF